MRKIYSLSLLSFISGIAASQNLAESYRPGEGYVSSEKTAKMIAEAVLVPIYGIDEINKQKPFKVVLKGKNWIVEGSTPADRGIKFLGGHFTIHIARSTGEITHLSHSK
jgi:hypothetical protein